LRPKIKNILTIHSLLPKPIKWPYFCLYKIRYHNHFISIFWDKFGDRYGFGSSGFFVFVDDKLVSKTKKIMKIKIDLDKI
jgi:hypothetical protein